jgi:hypothetical protein
MNVKDEKGVSYKTEVHDTRAGEPLTSASSLRHVSAECNSLASMDDGNGFLSFFEDVLAPLGSD